MRRFVLISLLLLPVLAPGAGANQPSVDKVNALLMQSERKLTTSEGLPRRPWYRHQIYAAGYYTGYGAKTLPGVREAIEQKNWKQADAEIGVLGRVLQNEATLIDSAAAELKTAVR